jgi:hypothetical protein
VSHGGARKIRPRFAGVEEQAAAAAQDPCPFSQHFGRFVKSRRSLIAEKIPDKKLILQTCFGLGIVTLPWGTLLIEIQSKGARDSRSRARQIAVLLFQGIFFPPEFSGAQLRWQHRP